MQLLALFYQPIDLDALLTDLRVQSISLFLPPFLSALRGTLEDLWKPLGNLLFPLTNLRRMDPVALGDLLNRLPSLQRLKADFRLELSAVPFSFTLHLVSLFLSPTPEKSYLTPGPVFGGHFTR